MNRVCRKQYMKNLKRRKGWMPQFLHPTHGIYKQATTPTTTISFDTTIVFCLKKRKNVPHLVAEGGHYFNKHPIEIALKYYTMNKK